MTEAIQRYLDVANLKRMHDDFPCLIKAVQQSYGELDLSLRKDYFNIYYQGNSLAKITFRPDGDYEVTINAKFLEHTGIRETWADSRPATRRGNYDHFILPPSKMHPFLKTANLAKIKSRIRKVNWGEEVTFEQMLIADNQPAKAFLIIDRQVSDRDLRRRRLDLLGLRQVSGAQYAFVVLEVKMGRNRELSDQVASQLETYVKHIGGDAFESYKKCYEETYRQRKLLGLMEHVRHETIEIVRDVRGLVVVGGYSGQAREQIKELKANHPKLTVRQFQYELTDSHGGLRAS